jgi:hypothetical protein
MKDLISERTRAAVRDMMSVTVLREIDDMWQDERFAPGPDPDPPVGGQRVTRFQAYLDQVDWTDPRHVTRALRVFEIALRPHIEEPATPWVEKQLDRIRRLLANDGCTLSTDGKVIIDEGKIVGRPVLNASLLNALRDPAAIHEHLDRITAALDRDDPAQAIGSAKELIESTAKLVLRERGQNIDDKTELPQLIYRAQDALDIHPGSITDGPDGSEAVKKILGGATTVANGIGDLRNKYGTGHRPDARRAGLGARHARLALNATRLWCEFMLDTLADNRAPWRRRPTAEDS